jgi:hypothetical protein
MENQRERSKDRGGKGIGDEEGWEWRGREVNVPTMGGKRMAMRARKMSPQDMIGFCIGPIVRDIAGSVCAVMPERTTDSSGGDERMLCFCMYPPGCNS